MNVFQKLLAILLYAVMFITPLIVIPSTSEAFEFNKLVFVYSITIASCAIWIGHSLQQKKLLFRRTPLDIPLLIYLGSLSISTVLSIDKASSLFGTYGRFNGGLLSHVSYALLYWIFVSLLPKSTILKSLYLLVSSAVIVSSVAVIEHFGISLTCFVMTSGEGQLLQYLSTVDTSCWTQDFQARVFATIGQPNWLAAWLVALIPIIGHLITTSRGKRRYLSVIFLILIGSAVVFTKSRSGYLGLAVAAGSYTYLTFLRATKYTKHLLGILLLAGIVVALSLYPKVFMSESASPNETIVITDSGVIRTSVWRGALSIWNDYKLFGSGPETFHLMFPRYKPLEFNMTSEWDFVFNKSHNQYLDILANTGVVTFVAYLQFIGVIITHFLKSQNRFDHALVSGFLSILVTQGFGFAVVVTSLLLALYPLHLFAAENVTSRRSNTFASYIFSICLLITGLWSVSSYWYADVLYSRADSEKRNGDYGQAILSIKEARSHNPHEPLYLSEQADIEAYLATLQSETSHDEAAARLAENALESSLQSLEKSPHNHLFLKRRASILIRMAAIDDNFLNEAKEILEVLTKLMQQDPEIHFNYALILVRTGDIENADAILNHAIMLKPNYKNPRLLRAELLINANKINEALDELQYIKNRIDPYDQRVNELYDQYKE